MKHLKFYILSITTIFTICIKSRTQSFDSLYFKQYENFPDRLLSYRNLENSINLFPGNYKIMPTGVIVDGHLYHIRIKEPDISAVIPMPNPYKKSPEEVPFRQQNRDIPFHSLLQLQIPPLNKND